MYVLECMNFYKVWVGFLFLMEYKIWTNIEDLISFCKDCARSKDVAGIVSNGDNRLSGCLRVLGIPYSAVPEGTVGYNVIDMGKINLRTFAEREDVMRNRKGPDYFGLSLID
jgi:hypothetical protein